MVADAYRVRKHVDLDDNTLISGMHSVSTGNITGLTATGAELNKTSNLFASVVVGEYRKNVIDMKHFHGNNILSEFILNHNDGTTTYLPSNESVDTTHPHCYKLRINSPGSPYNEIDYLGRKTYDLPTYKSVYAAFRMCPVGLVENNYTFSLGIISSGTTRTIGISVSSDAVNHPYAFKFFKNETGSPETIGYSPAVAPAEFFDMELVIVKDIGVFCYIKDNLGSVFSIFDTGSKPNIIAVNQGSKYFTIEGNHILEFKQNILLHVYGSTGNNGAYNITSSSMDGTNTKIYVFEAIPSAVVDGHIGSGVASIFAQADYRPQIYLINIATGGDYYYYIDDFYMDVGYPTNYKGV